MGFAADDIPELKQQCETWLRQGQFLQTQEALQSLTAAEIPRHHLADLSGLARRAHVWRLGLRWLHPVVRPKVDQGRPASAKELMEYALALQKAGALREADEILSGIDVREEPRSLLSRAYVRMARWDYSAAEPFLFLYLESPGLSSYEKLIGRVNWLACLVFLRDARVENLLSVCENELREGGHQLLLSNCLEIRAQDAIIRQDWESAEKALARARELVDLEKNLDALFILKWQAVLSAMKGRTLAPLQEFRSEALKLSHWETLRDLDFYQAYLAPEGPWAKWVYFGTPHAEFRRRLEKVREFPEEDWIQRGTNTSVRIDPWFPGSQDGDLSHRSFVLLLRDLYRPLRVGEAFSELFPDEYFNPESSPNRVHQAMTRMRKWIDETGFPFRLLEDQGSYSLRMDLSVSLRVRKELLEFEETRFMFQRFYLRSREPFTSEECARTLGLSRSAAQRLLKKAVESGVVERLGESRSTLYRYLHSPQI